MLTYRGRFPSPVMEKLIITVAPTGSVPRKKDTPHVPVTPDEIAETAYLCEQAGAAIIHVHCRDENERPTSRFEIFKETVDKIRKRTKLIEGGLVKEPAHFQLVMGVDGGIPATPENLLHMRNQLPSTATYVVAGMARMQLPMTTLAILTGGHVRVGLEDNLFLKKGVLARNEELVARARHLADDLQREVATPQEARKIMDLPSASAGHV